MNTTTTPTAVELFANDYLMVAENDAVMYRVLKEFSRLSVVGLSAVLQARYEELVFKVISEIKSAEKDKFSQFEINLMMQLLSGWGSQPFDTIAREVKDWE